MGARTLCALPAEVLVVFDLESFGVLLRFPAQREGPVDISRIDLLFQYALASAAQEDNFRDRELGPIHLLKYAYLGDLGHAEQNEGKTFSGTPWVFHSFGPWSLEAWRRVPDAARAFGAKERHFSSQFQEDNVRWGLQDTRAPDSIVKGIPASAALAIRRAVHEFGTDTTSLLHYVYKTPPILNSSPGEILKFSPSRKPKGTAEVSSTAPLPQPSKTRLKKLKALAKERLSSPRNKRLVSPVPAPRYDQTFLEGQEWLEALVGDPISSSEGVLTFDESVWKSRARNDEEIS